MTRTLLLYTESPTRRVFEYHKPSPLIFASNEITPEDRAVYDECIELPPLVELEATLKILRSIHADHVVSQTEYGLLPHALLSNKNLEAALLCTNKWLCRNALAEADVPVPRYALVETARDVRAFVHRYPIVLKPIVSTLASGVQYVESDAQLDSAIEAIRMHIARNDLIDRCLAFCRLAHLDMGCDPRRQFLVEEYIDARPLETDGLVFGNTATLFGTLEQVVSRPPHFFIEGYLFPADEDDLTETTRRALAACRVRDMGFAVEFRGDRVIEVNGRLGEDDGFPDLFHAATGTYPILKWLQRDASPVAPVRHAAIAYATPTTRGVVQRISTAPGVTPLVRPGEPLTGPHVAYALATHSKSSRAAYALARAMLAPLRIEIS